MKRENFLSSKWQPYPQAPAHHNLKGRVDRLHLQLPAEWQEILRPGDWISVRMDSQRVQEVLLLAPDLSFCGGSPAIPDSVWQNHKEFQKFLHWVREFFVERQFIQVDTPTLVRSPGTEPHLDVFSTEFSIGRRKEKFYLPTSPELHLKKVIAARGENIFEIRPCFRNGELSENHQPEFWMLEFYRSFETLDALQRDVTDLIQFLAAKMTVPAPRQIQTRSMASLFQEKLNFDLRPDTTREDLLVLAQKNDLVVDASDSWDDLFFRLFLDKIEREIPSDQLLFLNKYPPSQAALARLTDDGWGDRFEVYWQGLELGNAFHELNNPVIQRQRFKEDLLKKEELGKEVVALDEAFLKALESGMPPSSGIALGLERIFMALKGCKNITEFRLFPMPGG